MHLMNSVLNILYSTQWGGMACHVSLTQACETQAGRGEDVNAHRAAESGGQGNWRAAAAATAGGGGDGHKHSTAVQAQQIAPGFIHVQSVPLHTLHYHWLQTKQLNTQHRVTQILKSAFNPFSRLCTFPCLIIKSIKANDKVLSTLNSRTAYFIWHEKVQ